MFLHAFFSPTMHNCRTLLLLLFTIVGRVNAQQSSSSTIGQQVIYSNPQYYTLSTSNEEQQLDSSSSSTTAELSVGLLFNIRSKLSSNDESIYITGFEFYTHITGNVFYQLYSMDGEYYTEPDGASGGQGINDDWEKLDTKYLVSGGLAEGYGMCTRESYDEYVADGGGD